MGDIDHERIALRREARLREIEVEALKALDALWHASQAIAERSPGRRDMEIRLTRERLDKIIELVRA